MYGRLKKRGVKVAPGVSAGVDEFTESQSSVTRTKGRLHRPNHHGDDDNDKKGLCTAVQCLLGVACVVITVLCVSFRWFLLHSANNDLGRIVEVPVPDVVVKAEQAFLRAEAVAETWIRGYEPGMQNVIQMEPPVVVDPSADGKPKPTSTVVHSTLVLYNSREVLLIVDDDSKVEDKKTLTAGLCRWAPEAGQIEGVKSGTWVPMQHHYKTEPQGTIARNAVHLCPIPTTAFRKLERSVPGPKGRVCIPFEVRFKKGIGSAGVSQCTRTFDGRTYTCGRVLC